MVLAQYDKVFLSALPFTTLMQSCSWMATASTCQSSTYISFDFGSDTAADMVRLPQWCSRSVCAGGKEQE